MATPFSIVNKKFLNKITDYQLLSIPTENLESILFDFMESAIARFRNCKQKLKDYDDTLKQFNNDISLEEIEILVVWMLYAYHDQNIMRIELLRQSLSSKDFVQYSQANHLTSLIELRDKLYEDAQRLMKYYSYDNNDLRGLTNEN